MDKPKASYYLIRLNPPPEHVKIRQNRKENYRWRHRCSGEGLCEIGYLHEGTLSEIHQGQEITYPQGSVYTNLFTRDHEKYSISPVMHEFYLQFSLAEPPQLLPEDEVSRWANTGRNIHCAILPEYISNLSACERIGSLLKTGVNIARMNPLVRSLKIRTIIYECLTILTEQAILQAREHLQRTSRDESPFTRKARKFVEEHLSEKLQVSAIAEHVGISYEHMNRVFRRDMGMTLVDYINRTRIRRVEQYITQNGATMEKAADLVGISDTKYLSRLFRRYVGISATEFRQTYQERRTDPPGNK